jgi:dTDP-4-dehydrorhamnose 3,5-epimerase
VNIIARPFSGILVIEPKRFEDERGFFLESFEIERYRALGVTENFVQDSHSRSKKNVLRGLHFTRHKPQTQLLTVMNGKIFDVVVDIRRDSQTFGQWFGTELSGDGISQIYMSHGFAHGFCVLSDSVDLHYKVSQRYDPQDDGGLLWNDAQVNIDWPIVSPIVSIKDKAHRGLGDIWI